MKCIFDQKFGEDFVAGVPHSPGVYRFFNRHGELVYVGKAKDLRRRLSQYRAPKRVKAHRKMKRIVKSSARLEFEVTASEKDALLLENALIQQHRPRLNVAGAFSFLYPSIGLKRDARHVHLALSTQAEALAKREFRLFGCYRNRSITKAGFEALLKLFEWLGHPERAPERLPYTSWQRFRQIPKELDSAVAGFLLGESDAFLEAAILQLLEKPAARRQAADVQECMESLKLFFDTECRKLKSLRAELGVEYIAQEERDRASIRAEP
ncbi:MAG: hypothetical protein AUK47_14705 [Deltaproteobacteria bacterium CG2_30_63_29]|nr:MAG: hypothetical protein AUK47_14705 [Deltaproteobacteria bacterium CG2_30_63_29]